MEESMKTRYSVHDIPQKADFSEDVYLIPGQDDSFEMVYFLLKDCAHKFTIGLSDVLECLKFAEKEGLVPPLPNAWWGGIRSIYPDNDIWLDLPEEEEDETF